jgi:hypothetical protein
MNVLSEGDKGAETCLFVYLFVLFFLCTNSCAGRLCSVQGLNDDKLWILADVKTIVISLGLKCLVVRCKTTDLPEENVASKPSQAKPRLKPALKDRIIQSRAGSAFHLVSRCLIPWIIRRTWRWILHVPLKRRLIFKGRLGVISQKIKFFLTPTLRT